MINKRIAEIIIGVLAFGNIFFAYNYFLANKELQVTRSQEAKVEVNQKVVDFAMLFIKKVLQANTVVDFETRLSLENSVRDLNDPEIMAEWQNFTNSKTQAEAQDSVKKLLEILVSKIQK